MRHGDRTPKQKVKFTFSAALFSGLIGEAPMEEIVYKKPEQFLKVQKCIQLALDEIAGCSGGGGGVVNRFGVEEADCASLQQILKILEAKGTLAGTKVQLRPLFDRSSTFSLGGGVGGGGAARVYPFPPPAHTMTTNAANGGGTPGLTKMKMVQIIIKWGGLFTHGGFHHSQEMGKNLRTDLNIINKGLSLDIQVLSSSEKRVIDTAETLCSSLLQTTLDPEFILVTKEVGCFWRLFVGDDTDLFKRVYRCWMIRMMPRSKLITSSRNCTTFSTQKSKPLHLKNS